MRRQKGEGSITELPNGRYRVRIETTPTDGKRHWLTKVVDTKTAATKTLRELQRQKEDLDLIATNRPNSFSRYIKEYLNSKLAQGISESTIVTYTNTLNQVGRLLGDIPIDKLTLSHFDSLVASWREDNQAERTIRSKVGVTSNMLDWCVYKGYITTNLLSYHKETQKRIGAVKNIHNAVLSPKEHKALKEAMKSVWENDFLKRKKKSFLPLYIYYPIYVLAYESGMRVGEVAALKWQHVDFKTNTIMVRKTQKKSTKGGELLGKPKYNSIRDIVVSQETMDILKTLKESYGDKISEYVFSSYRSHWKAISTDTYRDVLQVYKERVGMTRPFTFHDIRHTNASLMIYAGVPISVVSERLGHSSVAVTYSTYAHVINDCAERRQALVKA